MFEKQRNKIEFEVKKEVKDKDGKKWTLTVDGHNIGEDYFDIWHDDYIVSFDCHGNLEGHSYAKNRFESIEAFKTEVFRAFGLTEPAQMTFFRGENMSKSVLTSINPPHTNNIFAEIKQIEWRLRPLPMGKHYCYETKKCFGRGKVIGQYEICRVEKFENINLIPKKYIDSGCVPVEFLEAYSKGKPLYANFIASPKLYDKPKELSEFIKKDKCPYAAEVDCSKCILHHCLTRPPQSWCYVEDMGVVKE